MRSTLEFGLLVLLVALQGCGGAKATQPTPAAPRIEPVIEEPPPPPSWVIVHRNTPIRLQPNDDAPFLQYRTSENQEKFDARRAKEAKERAAAEKKADAEWWESEKKRREKLRKRLRKYKGKRRTEIRERDAERAEARVVARAERKLRANRKQANKYRLRGTDRYWIPFRRHQEKDGWLQLSPVERDAEPPHCYRNNFGHTDRLDATFWVKESDLQKVTTKNVTTAPSQGTQVILRPGVALKPIPTEENPDRYEAFVDGFVLKLTIPADSVGTEYVPIAPFEAPMTDAVFSARALAGDKLRLASGMPLPYNPYHQLYAMGTLTVGSRFYVTTQTACGEYTVRTKPEHIEPVGKRRAMRLSADEEVVKPPYARAGAMASMPDGDTFARVRQDFPLGKPTQVVGTQQCFRTAVWGKTDAVSRSLELCFEPHDLELPES